MIISTIQLKHIVISLNMTLILMPKKVIKKFSLSRLFFKEQTWDLSKIKNKKKRTLKTSFNTLHPLYRYILIFSLLVMHIGKPLVYGTCSYIPFFI